jgi:hypothetical protein
MMSFDKPSTTAGSQPESVLGASNAITSTRCCTALLLRANGIALSDILEPLQRRPRNAVSLASMVAAMIETLAPRP